MGWWAVSRPEQADRPLQPLATVAGAALALLCGLILAAVLAAALGNGSIFGWGDTYACAPIRSVDVVWSVGDPLHPHLAAGVVPLPGGGSLCASRPSVGQRVFGSLTEAPTALVYLLALAGLVRLLRVADRRGPFHTATARTVAQLGWWLLLAVPLAAVVEAVAGNALLADLVTDHVGRLHWVDGVHPPFAAIITGTAVVTVARLLRIGAGMREEIEATV
ncbi:MAG: hypothetical protein V7637_5503 [Mycobacteriales bacterium]|jgi:hypothetical protein